MAVVKFLHILTVVSLAILHASFDARPVNALSVERGHLGRDLGHAHAEIAKKRADSKKCRPRPSSASQNPVAPTTYANNYAPSPNPKEPAQTTSSSQPASTNTPSSVNSKIMIVWSNNEQPSLPNFGTGSKRLVYNWDLKKYSDFNVDSLANFEFVPTVHSPSDFNDEFKNTITPGYAKYIKFLNEPDITSQANCAPETAAQLWNQYFEPLVKDGYSLIGPSVTGGGYQWMQTFLSHCSGCHIYAQDVHYYGIDSGDFISTVNKFHQLLPSLPMWLTEVGCKDYVNFKECNQGVFNAFFPGVMSYVESTDWIHQLGWFGMFTTNELPNGVDSANSMVTCPDPSNNKQCKPNSLGSQYLYNYN